MPNFDPVGIPGGNPGGTNVSVPGGEPSGVVSIGGHTNPFLSGPPSGQQAVDPMSMFPANTAGGVGPGGDPTQAAAGLNPATIFGSGASGGAVAPTATDFINSAYKAGYHYGDAMMLWNFLQGGAGFSPQVANAYIAAMQPNVQRQQASLLEQFSGMGNRYGSPAAVGMGDFMSQVNLNEGQIFAGLYQNAVQNYMDVLLNMKGPAPKSFFQNLLDTLTVLDPFKGGGQTPQETPSSPVINTSTGSFGNLSVPGGSPGAPAMAGGGDPQALIDALNTGLTGTPNFGGSSGGMADTVDMLQYVPFL